MHGSRAAGLLAEVQFVRARERERGHKAARSLIVNDLHREHAEFPAARLRVDRGEAPANARLPIRVAVRPADGFEREQV